MDADFYIEESNPLKTILTIIFVIGLIFAGLWFYFEYNKKDNLKLQNITIELGSKLSYEIEDYATGKNLNNYLLDVSSVHLDEEGLTDSIGEYSYKVIKGSEVKKGKIYVKDTTPPEVSLTNLTVGVNEVFEADEFLTECIDISKLCYTSFESDIKSITASPGNYVVKIIIKDESGNITKKDANLIVSNTTSLENIKATDFTYESISPEDHNWNKTYTYKFDKCVLDTSKEYDDKISETSAFDYSTLSKKIIKEQQMLVIYNKYDYVIGFSVKIVYSDNTVVYVEK